MDSSRLQYAEGMIRYYYNLRVPLPYYVGGYFWCFYAEDCVPATKPLWRSVSDGCSRQRARR